ncbi:hypothetical protein JCM31739_10770 [Faecalimonas canis]
MKKWKRFLALFCAVILTFSVIPISNAENSEKVNKVTLTPKEYEEMMAYDEAHHHEVEQYNEEINDIDFPIDEIPMMLASDLVYHGKVQWHGYDTGKFTVGGRTAFCIQHKKLSPATGTAYTTSTWNNDVAKKILYYGFQGQRPWGKFQGDVHARMLTSFAMSYLIQGRFSGDNYVWTTGKLNEFINYCRAASLPNTNISFSKTNVTAYVEGNVQRTEVVKFNAGDYYNTVTIKVPSGITLHNVSTGAKITNGNATLKGGQSFYISAPLSHTGSWSTGALTGTLKTVTSVTRVNPNGNNQDLAYANYGVDTSKKTSLTVNFLSKGKLNLIKTSANPEITNGSSCYSFEGAEFGVYNNANVTSGQVGKLVTDKAGKTNTLDLNAGTYWIKELKAPKGYALSSEVKKIELSAGKTVTVTFSDIPQTDPINILLGKVDRETNLNKPQGSASLQGAEFTVKYYGGLWEKDIDPSTLGQKPVRTWVFKTDKDGFCTYDVVDLVSGDDLYVGPNGDFSLPIGTITIQETKAPEGYLINPEVFVRQITPEGNDQFIDTYNQPTIPENILKLDLVKKQEGTDIVIPDAEFEHVKPDGTVEKAVTDENGQLSFKGLQHGKHTLRELNVMDGYLVNGNVLEFDVAEDNTITLTSKIDDTQGKIKFDITPEGNISIVVEDKLAPFDLLVHKINDKNKVLEGAEFTLYADKDCKQEVKKVITDDKGLLSIEELTVGTKYYLKETKAPTGYRLPVDAFGKPIVYELYTESTPVKDEFIFYVNGKAYTSTSEGMFTVTGTKADREVNVTVINERGSKLPVTGSALMLPLMFCGAGMILFSYYRKKN